MNKYGKYKLGCLKYLIFAVAIVLVMGYMFTTLTPKASQTAKEELLERLFGREVRDTTKLINTDTIPYNKNGFYVNRNVDINGALKTCFNYKDIEVIYVGISESRIPTIVEGKLTWINLSEALRAKSVKFKDDKGLIRHVYIIYDRLTGEVVDVANDERYIVNINHDNVEEHGDSL